MSRTVLVADDNLTVQRMAAEMLSEEGMNVVTVANGMAAIKKLPDVKPLVVVADVDMPGKNGYEVCDFVKSQPELGYVRVLLVVSDTDPLDSGRGAEVRADGIVKKPFDRQEFVSIVVKSLDEALALCPPSAAHEPPAATMPPEEDSAHEDQNELTPHEPIERIEILDSNKPNQPFENPSSEAPISSSDSVAGKVLEDDLAVHSALDPAHGAASGVHSEIAIMSEEPELTSQESSEPPVVDWPAGLMALIPSLDSIATLDGAPPEHADPHVEGVETELLEPPLPDLAVLCADSHEEPVLEPVPLPDLAQLDAPEAFFSEVQKVTALPDLDALPLDSAVEHAVEPASVADFTQSGAPEGHHPEEQKIAPAPADPTATTAHPVGDSPAASPIEPPPSPELPDPSRGLGDPQADLDPPVPAIDLHLVAAVVHAVVVRMAPPALPLESVESLERRLAEEIISGLTVKA